MTDAIDMACDREQFDREIALAKAHSHEPDLPYIGQCYNCEASLSTGRFCDSDCRNDYEARRRAERFR